MCSPHPTSVPHAPGVPHPQAYLLPFDAEDHPDTDEWLALDADGLLLDPKALHKAALQLFPTTYLAPVSHQTQRQWVLEGPSRLKVGGRAGGVGVGVGVGWGGEGWVGGGGVGGWGIPGVARGGGAVAVRRGPSRLPPPLEPSATLPLCRCCQWPTDPLTNPAALLIPRARAASGPPTYSPTQAALLTPRAGAAGDEGRGAAPALPRPLQQLPALQD